jgi:hypothetical protein
MGLLAIGKALTWEEAQAQADHVRWHGIQQFLHVWDQLKNRNGDGLLWGDEVRPGAGKRRFRTECACHADRIYCRLAR